MNHPLPSAWTPWAPLLTDLSLPEGFFGLADRYLDGLADANTITNLTSFDPRVEGRGHVVDSLQVLRDFPIEAKSVVDVGTGGGFPGFPLALARPGLTMILVDSVRKKQKAITSIVQGLDLRQIVPIWTRAEEMGRDPKHRETLDVALCRAVGRLPTVLELVLPLVRPGGWCLLHRGVETPKEISDATPHLKDLCGKISGVFQYRLPSNDNDRFIIRIEKTDQIDKRYPRRVGIPSRRPLW